MHNILSYTLFVILIFLFIIAIVSSYKYTSIGIFILLLLTVFFFFFYAWSESYNVKPDNDVDIDYSRQIVWINLDYVDKLNYEHISWAKSMMIKHAPNKLGIYCEKFTINRQEIISYKNKFSDVFKFDATHIYFKNMRLNNRLHKYCDRINLKPVYNSLRRITYT